MRDAPKMKFEGAVEALLNGMAVTRDAWFKADVYLVESNGVLVLLKPTLPGFTRRREVPWEPRLDDVAASDWSAEMLPMQQPEGDENRAAVLDGTTIYPKDPEVA